MILIATFLKKQFVVGISTTKKVLPLFHYFVQNIKTILPFQSPEDIVALALSLSLEIPTTEYQE
jgi:hypothetical protein